MGHFLCVHLQQDQNVCTFVNKNQSQLQDETWQKRTILETLGKVF